MIKNIQNIHTVVVNSSFIGSVVKPSTAMDFLVMENEIWKDVIGYEGKYQVSSLGRIKGIDRYRTAKNDSRSFLRGRVLKSSLSMHGYECIGLTNIKTKTLTVHRIVAKAFLPNIDNCPQINHINGIKTDNRVENLEWCSRQYNITHSIVNNLRKSRKGFPLLKLRIFSESDAKCFLSLKQSGMSYTKIGNKYNTDHHTIKRYIDRLITKLNEKK